MLGFINGYLLSRCYSKLIDDQSDNVLALSSFCSGSGQVIILFIDRTSKYNLKSFSLHNYMLGSQMLYLLVSTPVLSQALSY